MNFLFFGLSERRLQFKALCFFASPAQKLYFSLIFVNCFRLNLFLKAVKLYLILQLLCIAVRSILFGEGLKLAGAVFFGVAFLFPQLILCRDYCGNGHQALLARLFAVGLFYYNPELFNGFGRERRHKLFVLACFFHIKFRFIKKSLAVFIRLHSLFDSGFFVGKFRRCCSGYFFAYMMLDFIAAYGSCINLIENACLFERNLPRYRFVFRLHGRIFIIACKAWGCPSEKRILGENLGRSIIYSGRFFRVIVFAESFLIFFNFRGIDFSALGFFSAAAAR